MRFRKILIAVDESTFSANAADAGLDLAKQLGAEVAFVTVVDRSKITYDPNADFAVAELLGTLKREAKALLNAFSARSSVALPPLEFLETGEPVEKIVEAAKTWQADLIVMGTRGRSALANVFLGSVAQGVLRDAPCPVMVLRAQ
jgi:nucleotide-binding universal stress UspA family protein